MVFPRSPETTTGNHNTANGDEALGSNTTGNFNTTDGAHSLENNTTGSGTTANNVICIGIGIEGYKRKQQLLYR